MSKNSIASLLGLNDYGLSIKSFSGMSDRKVKVECWIKEINIKRLFKYTPAIRKEKLIENYSKYIEILKQKWPSNDLKVIETDSIPYYVTSILTPKEVLKVRLFPEIAHVWIKKIIGEKKVKEKYESWYSVTAEFIAQIEGQCKGFQTHERKVILVKAANENRAKQKAMKEFRLYETPHLNSDYKFVRWAFQKIIEIQDLYVIRDSDLDGEEVFYEWKDKKICPELEWHPV